MGTFNWANAVGGSSSSTTVSVSDGSNSISSGDLLIAIIALGDPTNTGVDPGTIVPPSGWTQITQGLITGGSTAASRTGSFYKIAGGSEPGNYSFSWTHSGPWSYVLLDYSGTASTLDATGANYGNGGTSYTAPSVSPVGASDWVLTYFTEPDGGVSSFPSGMTSRANLFSPGAISQQGIGVSDAILTSSGPTGAYTATMSAFRNGIGATITFAGVSATDDIAPRSGAMQAVILMRERASGLLEPVRELWKPKRPGFALM